MDQEEPKNIALIIVYFVVSIFLLFLGVVLIQTEGLSSVTRGGVVHWNEIDLLACFRWAFSTWKFWIIAAIALFSLLISLISWVFKSRGGVSREIDELERLHNKRKVNR